MHTFEIALKLLNLSLT